jgi:hypothetical protein
MPTRKQPKRTCRQLSCALGSVALLLLTANAPVASASPQVAQPGTPPACIGLDPYRATATQRTTCDLHAAPLSQVTTRADGGHEYHYEVGGVSLSLPLPPTGFNAATARQSEREAYGIPPEPTSSETSAHRLWEQMVNNYHVVTPPSALYTLGGSTISTTNSGSSENWSGYVDTGTKGAYNATGIIYDEPPSVPTYCEGAAASFWTGLGGYGTTPLDQAGTQIGHGFTVAEHQAWFEIYPQEASMAVNLFATPGYMFEVLLSHEAGNEVRGLAYNFHTGESVALKGTSSETYSGASAEYIAERPGTTSGLTPFADYSQWNVAEAWANGNHTYGPSHFSHEAINTESDGTLLSETSALEAPESGRTFHTNWRAYDHESGSSCPNASPTVTTEPASAITETHATLNGTLNPNHLETHYHFEYGETGTYGSTTSTVYVGSGSSSIPVSAKISELLPGKTYHYRLVGTNADGTNYGSERTFATPEQPNVFFADADDNSEISDWIESEAKGWELQNFFRDAAATGTSPAALNDNGNRSVFFSDKNDNGEISDWTWSWSSGWALQSFFQHEVEPDTSPAALMVNGIPNVFFSDKNDNGEISDWSYSATEGWHLTQFFRDAVESGTSPTAVMVNGTPNVFFSDANDNGEMSDWTWTSTSGWQLQNFFQDEVEPGTSPTAVVTSSGSPNVFFSDKDDNGEIADWFWTSTNGWLLARFYQDEAEPGTSPSAVLINESPNIFFSDKDDNGEISDWTWNATEGWHLTRFFQDEAEPGTSPSALVANGTPNVFFSDKDDNGEMSDWTFNATEGWHLLRFFKDQVAAGTSPDAVMGN